MSQYPASGTLQSGMCVRCSEDTNQPAHPPSLISLIFPPEETLNHWLPIEHLSTTNQDCMDEQADQRL